MDELGLDGKRALVTGGSRGIGRQIAVALARAGADVAVTARSEDGLAKTTELVEAQGSQALSVPGDLSRPEAPKAILEAAVDGLGGLEVLVNNAGVPAPWQPAAEITADQWDLLLQVNVKAPFFLAQAALDELAGGGRVVNVASVAGLEATSRMVPYSVTKAGLLQLTRDLATEWAEQGVRVNAVAPGWTATEMTDTLRANEGVKRGLEATIPLGRFGVPEEIAPAVVFLASDQARYVTGHTLVVDGGESI